MEELFINLPIHGVTMTPSIVNLFAALSNFQAALPPIVKEKPGHRHKYADINAVLAVIRPMLKEHKLNAAQPLILDQEGNDLVYTLISHTLSGEYMGGSMKLIHDPEDLHAMGGSVTYTRRYALVSFLGIEQEDDDGQKSRDASTKQKEPRTPISNENLKEIVDAIQKYPEPGQKYQEILTKCKVQDIKDLSSKQYGFVMKQILG